MTKDKIPELLPCPFCKVPGQRADKGWGENKTLVGCTIVNSPKCTFHPHVIVDHRSAAIAVSDWNRRSTPAPITDDRRKEVALLKFDELIWNLRNRSAEKTVDADREDEKYIRAALSSAAPDGWKVRGIVTAGDASGTNHRITIDVDPSVVMKMGVPVEIAFLAAPPLTDTEK